MHYPQIDALVALKHHYSIKVTLADDAPLCGLIPVNVTINNKNWRLYIHDVHADLNNGHEHFMLYLVLRELERYNDAPDFLRWCAQNGGSSSSLELLVYYKQLGRTIIDIENIIGKINSQISPMDYELRTSVINRLLEVH